jgi:hypothetical protein
VFIVPENTIIPEHVHPNVDSIEVYMGGNIHDSPTRENSQALKNILQPMMAR